MGAFVLRFWFMSFPAKKDKIVVVGFDTAGPRRGSWDLCAELLLLVVTEHLKLLTPEPTNGITLNFNRSYLDKRPAIWWTRKIESLVGNILLRNSCCHYCIRRRWSSLISFMKDELLFRLLQHLDLQHSVVYWSLQTSRTLRMPCPKLRSPMHSPSIASRTMTGTSGLLCSYR